MTGVAAIYNPALKPAEEKPIAELTQMVRRLLQNIADGKARPEQFTEELQKHLFPDEIQGLGPALKENRWRRAENLRYRARCSQRTIMASVGLTREDKIAKLDFPAE